MTSASVRSANEISKRELIQLHVIFRHGQRTPDEIAVFPKHEPHRYYPYGAGQLTNTGKSQTYDLGKLLRERYNDFLGEIYLPEEIEAWSTEFDRTKTSLLLVLAALYPPKKELIWQDQILWQPIPYKYVPIHTDKVLGNLTSHAYRSAYNKNFKESSFARELMEKHSDMLIFLEEKTGWKMDNTLRCYMVNDTLNCEKLYGNELPEWTKQIDLDELKGLAVVEVSRMMIDTVHLKRLVSGHHLEKITSEIYAKIDGKSAKKIVLYSGHDINIMGILALFDMMYPHLPGFSSCAILEVYKTETGYEIELWYRDGSESTFERRTFPDGLQACSYETWKKTLDVYRPIEDIEIAPSIKSRIHIE